MTQVRSPLAMNARCESALRGSTARCSASRSCAALEPVVLVAGAFGKQRAERVDVGRDVLGAQPRRQAAIEKAGGRVRRPVEAVRERRRAPRVRRRNGTRRSTTSNRALGASSSVRSSGCDALIV